MECLWARPVTLCGVKRFCLLHRNSKKKEGKTERRERRGEEGRTLQPHAVYSGRREEALRPAVW